MRILTPSQASYLLAATKVRDIEEALKEKVIRKDALGIMRLERAYQIAKDQLRFASRELKGERSA